MFCKVVFDVPLDRDFDYHIPAGMETLACPGVRVTAPFGPRLTVGLVVRVSPTCELPPAKIKNIVCVVDQRPVFGSDLFELAHFMKKNWGGAIGQILFALVPPQPYFKLQDTPVPAPFTPKEPALLFTGEQQAVWNELSQVNSYEFYPVLLRGPLGTGKTQLCLQLAQRVLQNCGQVLMTVPDIVAAKDFIARAQKQFGAEYVFCWHSKISLAQKKKYFSAVANGVPCVVIAMRSGILLPFKNLRLSVILQEEDENYKQEENKPYYHVRDLALLRGQMHSAMVVFVSQTPSLEMLKRVQEGRVVQYQLTAKPAGAQYVPQVQVTGKRAEKSKYISAFLAEEIRQNLIRKEPVLLLLNRRGYSNAYYCLNCGEYARCKKCGAILSRENTAELGDFLLCKKCGARETLQQKCPKCSNVIFKSRGSGTQKIVTEVQKLFPQARILRLDSDSLKTKSGQGHQAAQAIYGGEADILIGTRLAASMATGKKITLFGVLDADLELDSPDFRASEKFGQLLFHLRNSAACVPAGRLIIQASSPDIYPFEWVIKGDWEQAAAQEMALREAFVYPPFARLVRVTLKNKDKKELSLQTNRLKSLFDGCTLETAGPVPCGNKTDKLKKQYLLFKLTDEQYYPVVAALDRLSTEDKKHAFKLSADPYDFY